jgi:hypothetical protein
MHQTREFAYHESASISVVTAAPAEDTLAFILDPLSRLLLLNAHLKWSVWIIFTVDSLVSLNKLLHFFFFICTISNCLCGDLEQKC